jgi:hypothetical protein
MEVAANTTALVGKKRHATRMEFAADSTAFSGKKLLIAWVLPVIARH